MRGKLKRGNHRQRERRDKCFWVFTEVICLAVLIICITIFISRETDRILRIKEEQEAKDNFISIVEGEERQADVSQGENIAAQPLPPMFAKAEKLLQQNSDLVGMLAYDNLSLYVCQADDNSYYASHRFDGSEDPAGMIYMDYRCSIWPQSDNLILYGHNMRDGSRFGKLNRFANQKFIDEDPFVRFATLYEMADYRPVSVFYTQTNPEGDDYFDFARIEFDDQMEFESYIQEISSRSVVSLNAEADYGEQLLTLVTCSGDEEGERLVVVCVMENKQ